MITSRTVTRLARAQQPAGAARQRGAALVIGMILLMVLTLLAISGMNTATVELQMAGNMQYSQNAFQAAETGIEITMQTIVPNTGTAATIERTALPGTAVEEYESVTRHNAANGVTDVLTGGYSMGVSTSSFKSYHFDITSTGTSARNARVVNTQSFFVIGPSGS